MVGKGGGGSWVGGWGGFDIPKAFGGGPRTPARPPLPPARPAAEEQAGGERRTFGSGRAPLDEAAPPHLNKSQIRVIHT